jgi:DNA-binding MarR family transcriptional regulator
MDLDTVPVAASVTAIPSLERSGQADLALDVADLLGRTVRRLHRGTNEALAPLGLSRTQARLVRLLADRPLRMAAIAERLAVVPRTVTDIVDGVEAAGFVVRRPDPDDRRATLVELAPEGRLLLDRLDALRRGSAEQVLGRLDPRDLAALHAVLLELTADASDRCRPCPGGHVGPPVVHEGPAR